MKIEELFAEAEQPDFIDISANIPWTCFVPINSAESNYSLCYSQLTPNEKHRAERFTHQGAKQQFVMAHGILNHVLSKHLKIEVARINFKETEHHKPFATLPDGSRPLEFNISHCSEWVALIVADQPVGIDIEGHRPMDDMRGVAEIVFTEKERDAIFSSDSTGDTELFFRHWSCKEAYLKAEGTGFMKEPKSIEMDFDPSSDSEGPIVWWSDAIPGHSLAWSERPS
ncbi:MAG: 4'-phosphopantetheinyl transferase superfamily protein [Verrucomicrobia bacterium]|nr:4'-phosphopantetheinyl transferase superfamily protein [Verrucomicrobiota bacterium]